MSLATYVSKGITYGVLGVLVIFVGYEIVTRDWADVFVVGQALILSFIPFMLRKKFNVHVPYSLDAGIVLFMFATLFLGEVRNFYNDVWWWDVVLHGFAGFGLTIISFILFVVFFRKSDLQSSPLITTLFAFSFGIGSSVLWEVYEFAVDSLFYTQHAMQPSNADTMFDLIAGITGSLVVSLFGYAYLKFRYTGFVADVIHEGGVENQHLKDALAWGEEKHIRNH